MYAEELAGNIAPGVFTIVETTSGTAGRRLAFVARRLGYSVRIYMPVPYYLRRLEALQEMLEWDPNSEPITTSPEEYVAGTVDQLKQFYEASVQGQSLPGPRKYHILNHSRKPESINAFDTIIHESWKKTYSDEIDSPIVVAALGGGCFSTPWFSRFKKMYPKALKIGIEPQEAPVSFVRANGDAAYLKKIWA